MRLATVPNLPPDIVSALEICDIRTEADLLFPGSNLDIFHRLPTGTTTLQELTDFMALVAELTSSPGRSAADLLEMQGEAEGDLLSGVPSLDDLLSGLTAPRRVIEVSGDRGSGKTSLLLQLVLRHLASRPQSTVLWIDASGDFSAARAAEILESFDIPDTPVLERLQVSQAFDVDAVFQVLEEVRSSLSSSTPSAQLRSIVVDTVTSLLSPLLSPVSSQGHAIMTAFMRELRALAQAFSLTVFVLNSTVAFAPFVAGSTSNNPNIRKPALGPSFTFMADATLWLALCKGNGGEAGTKHVAQVYKSKITALRTPCVFEIRQGILLSAEEVGG